MRGRPGALWVLCVLWASGAAGLGAARWLSRYQHQLDGSRRARFAAARPLEPPREREGASSAWCYRLASPTSFSHPVRRCSPHTLSRSVSPSRPFIVAHFALFRVPDALPRPICPICPVAIASFSLQHRLSPISQWKQSASPPRHALLRPNEPALRTSPRFCRLSHSTMSEPPPTSAPRAPVNRDAGSIPESGSSKPQYMPYRPPNAEYTPPASPQPPNPYAHPAVRNGFGSGRSRQPAQLQMDTAAPPAYERPVYSPSPSASPPLPPLPSPKFVSRSRAPSLLRHAAVSSPLNDGFPRAEQPQSPTYAPMIRQTSNQSAASDTRWMVNPLASNPVNQNGPPWDPWSEDIPIAAAQQRLRGMTTSAQSSFHAHPPLRSATSIPDYGPLRASDRPNRSGAYKPDRGGPNWSHNDHYPPRFFRGEEPRASFRSGWTNGSSFIEASGTERSSMATGRSSIASNDNRASTYSRDRSEERDLSTDTLPTSVTPDEEDVMSTVEDVIDAYFDDDDDETPGGPREDEARRGHSSPPGSDAEHQDRSSSYSQDISHPSSPPSSSHGEIIHEPSVMQGERELSTHTTHHNDRVSVSRLPESHPETHGPSQPTFNEDSKTQEDEENQSNRLSEIPQISPLELNRTSTRVDLDHQAGLYVLQRLSEELPRRASILASERPSKVLSRPLFPRTDSSDSHKMQEIHKELTSLPVIPRSKSRLSRQDWAEFEGYAKRNSKGPSAALRALTQASTSSPPKRSDPLPEVDEDEAFPRRASTSIFDRRSTLFELGNFKPLPPHKAMTTNFGDNKPRTRPSAGWKKSVTAAERDRYGFKKTTDKISLQEYDLWFGKYDEYVSRRRNKWIALMGKQGLSTSNPTRFPEPCDKVKRYARKGFPPEWRGAMWWFYSGAQSKMRQLSGLYHSLVARVNNGELNKDDREAIERDLDRTFPDNIHFRPDPKSARFSDGGDDEPSLIRDLREVLSAFALNNPGIGYCQSLNFIAGLLLLFLKQDTERVFVLLTIITQSHLPGAHARSLANTEVNVLMMLIRDYLPKVWSSINDTDLVNSGPGSHAHPESKFQRQPTVALSCTSWFMSVFVGVLPIETVLRVWDAFLFEGPRALYRYALAIFKLGEGEIRKYRPGDGELFMAVQNLPRRCLDPNTLHDIAFVKKGFGSLTQNVIDQKRQFWREQNERAKRSASQKSKTQIHTVQPAPAAEEESRRRLGGLRRRASKRFLKKRV